METAVYILEDFRTDYEHGVIGVYDSFEKAKEELISILKESIMSYEDKLDECEKNKGHSEELRGYIVRLIKNVEKATPTPYYTCGQLYFNEHTLMAIQEFSFAIRKMTVYLE